MEYGYIIRIWDKKRFMSVKTYSIGNNYNNNKYQTYNINLNVRNILNFFIKVLKQFHIH